MKIKFNEINKIILFGGAPLLIAAAKWIKTTNMSLFIYTSPRHAAEPLNEAGLTLKEALDQLKVSYVITDDINTEPSLLKELTPNTLGLGIGEAWSFSEEIINQFNGRLLDFMGIPLPRYRGGAHYTWMILRNDKQGACNFQIINTEMIQGEFDSGEIIKTSTYRFPDSARTPMDYFNAAIQHEIAFIQEFLQEILNQKEFELTLPDESKSLYLPRLNTIQQAWIDWSWSGEEIEQFICAFDEPYRGASTYIRETRVHLKGATLDKTESPFHPFQSGIITRITPHEGIVIATRSGHLSIKYVIGHHEEDISSLLRIGERLYTPAEKFNDTLKYRAHYGSQLHPA
jgi:methionyl-tRNA formyltransferase